MADKEVIAPYNRSWSRILLWPCIHTLWNSFMWVMPWSPQDQIAFFSVVFLRGFDAKLSKECISSCSEWIFYHEIVAVTSMHFPRGMELDQYPKPSMYSMPFFFSCAFKASLKKSTWTKAPWIFEKSPTGVFPGKALCLLNTFTYFLFFSEKVQICKPSQILLLFLIGVKN